MWVTCKIVNFSWLLFSTLVIGQNLLTTMAGIPKIHTHLKLGFLLMSAFLRPVLGGLDWLFLLINWTKRKVLKDKALLYSI